MFSFYILRLNVINTITIAFILALTTDCESIDFDREQQYFQVDFYVFDGKERKPFKYSDPNENLQSLGLNKGKNYRWLIADCMADIQSMMELAKVFKNSHPEDNVILVDWQRILKEDPGFKKAHGEGYAEFRTALEYVSNVIVFVMQRIHMTIYDSSPSPSILDHSHIIGFGHAALIAGNAGWLANHKEEQIKEPGGYLQNYQVQNFLINRLTVVNPISFCGQEGDEKNPICQEVEKAKPGYKKELFNRDCAKFVDGIHTHRMGLSATLCPRQNGSHGLPHHRAVMINEESVLAGCEQESAVVYTDFICKHLLTHCTHQKGFQLYTEAMRLLGESSSGSGSGCQEQLLLMFGDEDPNVPGETLSKNFHFETKDEDPFNFGSGLDCQENPGANFPNSKSISDPRCADQNLKINKIKAWKWRRER